MTAKELIQAQLAETEFMLGKALDGLDERTADYKHANLMTPRETVAHLCECVVAARKEVAGEKHSWGTFQPADRAWDKLNAEYRDLRKQASDAILAAEGDGALKSANSYIIAHDNYHVGQLCAIRLAMDPEWDAYCIYQH